MTPEDRFSVLNRRRVKGFCFCALMLAAAGIARGQGPKQSQKEASASLQKHSRIAGVPYTNGKHGPLLADLFLPAGKGAHPAVVFLHGGAWKSGDRSQLQDVATFLAEKGYVGMAIDYDMTNTGDRFPVPLEEGERAVAWLRENAATYQIDTHRIAVAGSSAGGELAALVALDREPMPGAEVQAAVIFNGVLDLSDARLSPGDMVAPYLGESCAVRLQICRRASPVFQVHPGAPPFFVGHGTADRIVPYSQAEFLVHLLREAHVPVTPFVAKNAGHTYWKTDAWYRANVEAVLAFLNTSMPTTNR